MRVRRWSQVIEDVAITNAAGLDEANAPERGNLDSGLGFSRAFAPALFWLDRCSIGGWTEFAINYRRRFKDCHFDIPSTNFSTIKAPHELV